MRGGIIVALGVLARVAHADATLDKPAFTATPNELLAAAKTKPAGTTDAFILREDDDVAFDERGRITSRWHLIFVITSPDGLNDWGTLGAGWRPDHQDKPTMRARVIDPSGAVTQLDPSTITETVDAKGSKADLRRRLDAPLPRLQVGSIVEEEIVTSDREPLIGGGNESYVFNGSVPVVSARVTVSAPSKKKLKLAARGVTAKPTKEMKDGRQRVTYVVGPLPAMPDAEPGLPREVVIASHVIASVTETWSAVAREYRALLEKRLTDGAAPYPSNIAKTATADTAAALLAWVHHAVRGDDLEFGDASLVPSTPAETIKRGTGDAIDKALLIVSLFRQAGISADVAMINASYRADVDVDVPSLDVFDRALVRAKIGDKEQWVDPIDSAARIGQLRSYLQGRLVLVIADATTNLVTTPAASAKDNVYREVRTYEMPEYGHAKITEVSQTTGAGEPGEREWYRDTATDEVRKNLETYVADEYKGGKLDSVTTSPTDDVAKPLVTTLVISGSPRGNIQRNSGELWLFQSDVLTHLPTVLGNPGEKIAVRKYDYVLANPHITEIENRIVIPDELALPAPAPDKVTDWGGMKLTEKQQLDGRTFVVTYRLDADKPRLTPAEVTRIQDGARKLRKDGGFVIKLEPTSVALAGKGKFRDAATEAQRMIKLHPKEALHHLQLAGIYMDVGAGEAARREARKAVELEPNNDDAYSVLGWVLSTDTLGHPRGFDHDRAGSIAAYQKARKLNPKHYGANHELALMLERGTSGRVYDLGSDVAAAIPVWRDVVKMSPTVDNTQALIRALLWVGEAAEAEKLATDLPAAETRNALLVAAQAMGKPGVPTAIRTANTLGNAAERARILQVAALTLLMNRRYDEMRAIFAELGKVPDPRMAQVVQNVKRSPKSTGSVEDVAVDVMVSTLRPGSADALFVDKLAAQEYTKRSGRALRGVAGADLMSSIAFEEMLRAGTNAKSQTASGVARVELEVMGATSFVYLVVEKGRPKAVGASDSFAGIGRQIFTWLAQKNEAAALQMLDWVAADLANSRDPMLQFMSSVWGTSLPRTREEMGLAAALLANDTADKQALPLLKKCAPSTKEGQTACDLLLLELYHRAKAWTDVEDLARAWIARSNKQVSFPYTADASALVHLGKLDDAEQVIKDGLAIFPDDKLLAMERLELLYGRGQVQRAVQEADALATKPNATSQELNNSAWAKLADGNDLPNATLQIRRALQVDPDADNILNTAAAIAAEREELVEAKEHLDKKNGKEEPPAEDWYVHGRIFEQIGLRDDAVAAYKKATAKPTNAVSTDSYKLAQRRLKALGVTK